jgi:hypothetical protein
MNIRAVDAARGWRWLVEGIAIFRKNPAQWLLLIAALYLGSRIVLLLPFMGLAVVLFTPNFIAGLAHGAQALDEGKPLRFGYLASGFLKNAAQLVTIGGVSLVGHFLMLMAMAAVAGDALSGIAQTMAAGAITADTVNAMRAAAPRLLLSVMVGLGVSLPVMLAVWFAPLLVFFDDLKPVPAMWLSLQACIKNVLPLLVYCLAVLGPLLLMMQVTLALTRQPDLGIWLLAPILVPSLYAGYRDLFVREPAAEQSSSA